jgi:hypothetical protein
LEFVLAAWVKLASASNFSTVGSIIRAKALKVNAHLGVYRFMGSNAVFVIKEHDLTGIYKTNETDLQPSKILTFFGDPFHDRTQPNGVLQFSLHVMLMVAINCHHFYGQI